MSSFVSVDSIVKSFGDFNALNSISLKMEKGKQYIIRGESGSGKSTLMYILAGLERPSSGKVVVNELSLESLDDEAFANYRNTQIGLVFQFHFLLPSMNCLDNILLPAKIGRRDDSSLLKTVKDLALELKIEHCLKKSPFELSGGEQQRINIIRAISLRPDLLLCDEPTGSLDSENSQNVIKILKEVATLNHSTLVVVTHDMNIAQKFENHFELKDGQLL